MAKFLVVESKADMSLGPIRPLKSRSRGYEPQMWPSITISPGFRTLHTLTRHHVPKVSSPPHTGKIKTVPPAGDQFKHMSLRETFYVQTTTNISVTRQLCLEVKSGALFPSRPMIAS